MSDIIQNLRDDLTKHSLSELRQIARAVGVKSPTELNKAPLIESILEIADGEKEPAVRSKKDASAKADSLSQGVEELIERCRKASFENSGKETGKTVQGDAIKPDEDEAGVLNQDRKSETEEEEHIYTGVLEFTEKFWFLRTNNFEITSSGDVFMHTSFVNRFRLREGDMVTCKARRRKENECPGAIYIVSVNGVRPDMLNPRPTFESLTPCYPNERYTLEREGGTLTDRVVDLFSPIGKGQRALIVSPPKAGKTTMLKGIACSITANYPQAEVIVLLIDERPEEVTDIKRSVVNARVVYSTFDKGENHHTHAAMLTLEYAKRLVEKGRDVVILMDSITRLTRAYNSITNSGRMLSGGLDPQALIEPRKFFGSARNIEGGGSLTIIATALVDTGSRLDDVIYEEFKSAGNMELVLSRDLAEKRIFPAIDIKGSGARKEELLLSRDELNASCKFRQIMGKQVSIENVYAMINKTRNNQELCSRVDEWLRIYNGNDR